VLSASGVLRDCGSAVGSSAVSNTTVRGISNGLGSTSVVCFVLHVVVSLQAARVCPRRPCRLCEADSGLLGPSATEEVGLWMLVFTACVSSCQLAWIVLQEESCANRHLRISSLPHSSIHPCIHASMHPSIHPSMHACWLAPSSATLCICHRPVLQAHPGDCAGDPAGLSIQPIIHTYIHACVHSPCLPFRFSFLNLCGSLPLLLQAHPGDRAGDSAGPAGSHAPHNRAAVAIRH
jgi:hypothetical protein